MIKREGEERGLQESRLWARDSSIGRLEEGKKKVGFWVACENICSRFSFLVSKYRNFLQRDLSIPSRSGIFFLYHGWECRGRRRRGSKCSRREYGWWEHNKKSRAAAAAGDGGRGFSRRGEFEAARQFQRQSIQTVEQGEVPVGEVWGTPRASPWQRVHLRTLSSELAFWTHSPLHLLFPQRNPQHMDVWLLLLLLLLLLPLC